MYITDVQAQVNGSHVVDPNTAEEEKKKRHKKKSKHHDKFVSIEKLTFKKILKLNFYI